MAKFIELTGRESKLQVNLDLVRFFEMDLTRELNTRLHFYESSLPVHEPYDVVVDKVNEALKEPRP